MTSKDKAVQSYMLHPQALVELVAALDDEKGWDVRNGIITAYLESIHKAQNRETRLTESAAFEDFGKYIYCVLFNKSKSQIEDDWEGLDENGLTEYELRKLEMAR